MMMEENRRRRIDQILATGMTHEEMAEALQSVERSAHIWQACTKAAREENAEIRAQMDGLIKILRNDHNLDVCWDGLRHFWCIELTDEGVRKRDERDAENAKLRACLGDGCADCAAGMGRYADSLCDPIKAENEKLRELVRDMWRDGMCECDERCTCAECCEYHYHERMRELGIEVE